MPSPVVSSAPVPRPGFLSPSGGNHAENLPHLELGMVDVSLSSELTEKGRLGG